VANTPYRFAKAQSYEGGLRTPMIAFWPKGITARKGGYSDQVAHVMDFMKTFTDLSQAEYPGEYKGNQIIPTTGKSLIPSFKGLSGAGHQTLFNEHFGARYARSGNWKIVSKNNDPAWHLYDLSKDNTELNDLAAINPDKVKELEGMWKKWADENKVFPKPVKKK